MPYVRPEALKGGWDSDIIGYEHERGAESEGRWVELHYLYNMRLSVYKRAEPEGHFLPMRFMRSGV